jgi:hypothetical protein
MQTRIPEKELFLRFRLDLHQARRDPRRNDLISRCDVLQQLLFVPKQGVPGFIDAMFNSGFVKLADSLLREFFWRKDG